MATVLAPFDSFTVSYTARGQGTLIAAAFMDCYQQGTQVAQIQFLPKSLPFNTGGGLAAGGLVILYYELEQFQDVLAIIQREGPLAVWFDVDAKYGYVLSTTFEPVGELDHPVRQLVPE